MCSCKECSQKDLFLEQAEGYVKAVEKSTSPLSTMREFFEHCAQNDQTCGKKLNVVLKVLSFVRGGQIDKTRMVRQERVLNLC